MRLKIYLCCNGKWCERFGDRAEKTYIAGDDDQAIFKWAGADVDHFIALKEEVDDIQTLDQSYRIPGGPIHKLSQKIIGQVQNRFDKE